MIAEVHELEHVEQDAVAALVRQGQVNPEFLPVCGETRDGVGWVSSVARLPQSRIYPSQPPPGERRSNSTRLTIDVPNQRYLAPLKQCSRPAASLVFVYGFILITVALSFTESRLFPELGNGRVLSYADLSDNERFWTSVKNLAILAACSLASV